MKARAAHYLGALRPVVMRYLIWSSSTSGVEQRFGIGDRLAIEKTAASQVQESLVLQVAFDKVGSLKEKRAIAEPAQELLLAHPEHGPAATPGWTREQNGSFKREETD